MAGNYWQQVVPPWPRVPRRVWLTGAAVALSILSLVFADEVWTNYRQVEEKNWVVLAVILQVFAGQVLLVLWKWPSYYHGPNWSRLLLRSAVLAACVGILLLQLGLFFLTCLFFRG